MKYVFLGVTSVFVSVCVTAQTETQLFWLANALHDHKFTLEEAADAAGVSVDEVQAMRADGKIPDTAWRGADSVCKVLPYPGGRHPRIGFLDGAIDPMRGTKASVFAPDGSGFVVVDVPEAIFSNIGLLYLAHTHVPTIWDDQGVKIADHEWEVGEDGALRFTRTLPNGVKFGASVTPVPDGADMVLWLENGMDEALTELRTQICVMLKGMPGLTAQTLDNKRFDDNKAVAMPDETGQWRVETTWQHTGRHWGNERVPCIHADPVLPNCAPGERVTAQGKVRFYTGGTFKDALRGLKGVDLTPASSLYTPAPQQRRNIQPDFHLDTQ